MNIFVLDRSPITAAHMMCDKHIPKMVVESAQMMASALRRWGAVDEQMPIAKTSGKPYKGGYAHHPCTRWAGETRANFVWLSLHGEALLNEYYDRYKKVHACHNAIFQMSAMCRMIPKGILTPFALAMPDEFKVDILGRKWDTSEEHGGADDAVKAYRRYYHSKTFAKWEKGVPAPDWWRGVEVTA
jgi:hypothetical protein